MPDYGLVVKTGRIESRCPHQSGVIYTVPADKSWVCEDEWRQGHALVGFLKDVVALDDSRIKAAMQRWGIYFRERPLDEGME